jgi:hypothetical protein
MTPTIERTPRTLIFLCDLAASSRQREMFSYLREPLGTPGAEEVGQVAPISNGRSRHDHCTPWCGDPTMSGQDRCSTPFFGYMVASPACGSFTNSREGKHTPVINYRMMKRPETLRRSVNPVGPFDLFPFPRLKSMIA